MAWPVSEKLTDLGFRDSYREIHPDPVADPAFTQRSGERIDYVYAGGPSKTLDSKLVGEPGGENVDIEFAPWTSDHRAVLSSFGWRRWRCRRSSRSAPALARSATSSPSLERPRLGCERDRDRSGGLRPGRRRREARRPAARAARRCSTRRAGTRAPMRPCSPAPTAPRPSACPSSSATPTRRCGSRAEQAELRPRRADRRLLVRRPGEPLGLDRRLPRRRLQPEDGLLPDLGLRRGPLGRDRAAADHGRGDPRTRQPGAPVAAAARRLRGPLPARRPVPVGREHPLHGPPGTALTIGGRGRSPERRSTCSGCRPRSGSGQCCRRRRR